MTHITEIYLPKVESLNKTYAGKHWSSRKRYTDKMRGVIKVLLLEQGGPPFCVKWYSVNLQSNARTDIDNRIMAIKYLNDVLEKDLGWVKNDGPKVFREMSVEQVDQMNKDEFKATITFYEDGGDR